MTLQRSDWILVVLLVLAAGAGLFRLLKSDNTLGSKVSAPAAAPALSSSVPQPFAAAPSAPTAAATGAAVPQSAAKPATFPPVASPQLPHAFVVTEKVSAGAHPEGEEAFKALSELGVKTIISVDGAKPDVAMARKYGMRYVHLPVAYGNITPRQGKEIAKAINEMPGRIYLHCPQGMNRSAAAVAMGCVMNGSIKVDQVEALMATFGTGANYQGLLASARSARPVDPDELKKMKVNFVETQSVADIAEGMVEIDHDWEDIKRFQKSKWAPLPDHPELDFKREAQQLRKHFADFGALESAKSKSEDFQTKLVNAQQGAEFLSDTLAAKPLDPKAADAAVKSLSLRCALCHKFYRD